VLQNTFVNIFRCSTLIGQNGEFSFAMSDMFHKLILNLHVAFITNIFLIVFLSQKTIFSKTTQAYLVVDFYLCHYILECLLNSCLKFVFRDCPDRTVKC